MMIFSGAEPLSLLLDVKMQQFVMVAVGLVVALLGTSTKLLYVEPG